jgi:hypothetical protein
MEEDLNFSGNGRRSQFFRKWRQPQFVKKWKTTSISIMEDDLNFWGNGRRPQFFKKWKTTSIFREMEDDVKFLENRRWLKFSEDHMNSISSDTQYSFLLANVDSKFTIKNNLQIKQSQPSMTWAWHSSAQLVLTILSLRWF